MLIEVDQYGIFKQLLSKTGEQLEAPDPWLDRESVSGITIRPSLLTLLSLGR